MPYNQQNLLQKHLDLVVEGDPGLREDVADPAVLVDLLRQGVMYRLGHACGPCWAWIQRGIQVFFQVVLYR